MYTIAPDHNQHKLKNSVRIFTSTELCPINQLIVVWIANYKQVSFVAFSNREEVIECRAEFVGITPLVTYTV